MPSKLVSFCVGESAFLNNSNNRTVGVRAVARSSSCGAKNERSHKMQHEFSTSAARVQHECASNAPRMHHAERRHSSMPHTLAHVRTHSEQFRFCATVQRPVRSVLQTGRTANAFRHRSNVSFQTRSRAMYKLPRPAPTVAFHAAPPGVLRSGPNAAAVSGVCRSWRRTVGRALA